MYPSDNSMVFEPLSGDNYPATAAASDPSLTATATAQPLTTLTNTGLTFLGRYQSFLIMPLWFAARVFALIFAAPNQDVMQYFTAADRWLNHAIPYKQFGLEYPPGMLFLVIIPKFFAHELVHYTIYFGLLMMALDFILLRTLRWAGQLMLSSSIQDAVLRNGYLTLLLGGYIVTTLLPGELLLARYDIAVTLCLMLWLATLMAAPQRMFADLWLCLSIFLKIFPLVLIPLHAGYLYATWPALQQQNLKTRFLMLTRRALLAACLLICLCLPFYLQAGPIFWSFLEYHGRRGLQIESFYASLLMAAHQFFGMPLRTHFDYGCTQLVSNWATLFAKLSPWLQISALVGIYALTLPLFGQQRSRAQHQTTLIFTTTAVLLVLIGAAKVFSPQYVFWVAPFLMLVSMHHQSHRHHLYAQTATMMLLTGLTYLFYYGDLLQTHPTPVLMLLLRNCIVLAIAYTCVMVLVPKIQFAIMNQALQNVSRYRPLAALLATTLLFAWIFLANLSETTANDIWIQIRSGRDIIQNWALPDKEMYSATVLGRDFIAHEWLSSVIFYYLTSWFGGGGLSFLAAVVATLSSGCLYMSQPLALRKSVFYVPLIAFVSYLISFRMLVRPHVFTILVESAIILALEHWRRHGGFKQLWWLIPIQLCWINLHGAALFGPLVFFMCTFLVMVLVLIPTLSELAESRRFTWQDVGQLALMTGLLAAACFINPYGTKIVAFSVDLFNNDYVKSRVWEWTTPFMLSNMGYYWLWLYFTALILVWLCLLLRIRTLPIIDLALCSLVTYMSVRANRFVPDLVILSFPSMCRSLWLLQQQWLPAVWQRRRLGLELGMTTLLLCQALTFGYAHSAREHRPEIGWGFGGDMPYQEVAIIKRLNLSGIIFNEYSDGSVIIHDLVPQVRPVLDSRIDLYPIEAVNEYDQAYTNPAFFFQYLERHHVNIICLYSNRAHPGTLYALAHDPRWQLLSDVNGRVLYRKRPLQDDTSQSNS